MIGELHHVEINVSDLTRTCLFWGWLLKRLGYEAFQSWDQGRSWRLGNTYLVFVQVQEKYKESGYNRCRIGLNHLAFHAGTTENLEAIRTYLQSQGVRFLYEERYPHAGGQNHQTLFFEDPDRIKIELVAGE